VSLADSVANETGEAGNMSALFIRRPVATTLLTLAIALVGVAAYFVLPVAPLPQVDIPSVNVQAQLPGASPDVMASTVATPLERRLGVISNVTEMTSTSGTGSTNIQLQFGLDRDINGAARDVQAAINASRADLPTTLRSNPEYRKINSSQSPIMVIGLTSDTLSTYQVYDQADIILNQALSQVQGIGQVTLGGGASPSVRVEMNPYALNKYGIGTEDVRAAITSTNAFTPKGAVTLGARRYQIYTNDQATKAEDYGNVIVAYRHHGPVRIRDVAQVIDGPEDIHNLGLVNGKPGIILRLTQSPGANIIATADRIRALLPTLQAQLPPTIKLQVMIDNSTNIRASVADVERTLLIAIVLVVLVVLVFLRNGRATLIPGVAVTVSLIGTLAIMYLFGFSLDNLSLMALTIATGFVVDDAIVVLENITRHVESGMPRMQAALVGSREVGFTVLSMSISLIAVFIPILAMGGIVGRLFREFGVTLSASIVISLFISLTATPMMAARLIDEHPGEGADKKKGLFTNLSKAFERGFEKLLHTYERSLAWALDNSFVMLLTLFATILLTVYLYAIVPKGFFPQEDLGILNGGIQSDQSSSFENTANKMKRLQAIIMRDPDVSTAAAFLQAPNGFTFISLKPKAERKDGATGDMVIQRLTPKLQRVGGVQLFLQSAQTIRIGGRQSGAQYQYTLQSDDLTALRTWSDKLLNALKQVPDLTQVNTDQQSHALDTYIHYDRATAARFGITSQQIDATLNDSFGQSIASVIYNPLNQYHVIMEVAQPFQQTPDALKDVYVTPPSASVTAAGVVTANAGSSSAASKTTTTAGNPLTQGKALSGAGSAASTTGGATAVATGVAVSTAVEPMTPLAAFSSYTLGNTPLAVNHQNTSVAATISFNLAPGKSLSDAQRDVAQVVQQIGMPSNVIGSFQGTAQAFQQGLSNEPILILSALVAVYIVLGVLYESYIHPLTVLSSLPSAGVGAVLALLIFHVEFSIISLIGVILLIGIVKKNAIMIIDFALVAEREQGLSSRDAIYQACVLRFRPILMTTCAAILGALPLAIGLGQGGELRRPLGITIIGGLVVSQLLTLLTTPVVYLYLDKLRTRGPRRYPRGLAGAGPTEAPAPAE
jgi:multidrug efflux pump